ncbi:MAG: CheR family methyltransferase [Microcystaceae cyanobacterium]
MTQAYLSPELKAQFIDLIAKQTGIEVREQNLRTLKENIAIRVKALKLKSPEGYYHLLASQTHESDREWQQFVCLMTNRESYFFRDKGQFALLRNHIVSDLIERKKSSRLIRICSAGCSTGQEPYSIAILLQELIPDIEKWQIKIYGIDINNKSLETARKGIYNNWSFRMVKDDIKHRYFKQINSEYHLNSKIKKMVEFHRVNLVKDSFPSDEFDLSNMDLVICRNVFIYFVELAIVRVLGKFYNMLQPFGYLMTGHAEVAMPHLKRFQTKLFPESIIYQRPSENLENLGQAFQDYTRSSHQLTRTNCTFLSPTPETKRGLTKPVASPFISSSEANAFPLSSTPNKVELKPIAQQKKTNAQDTYFKEILEFIEQKSYFLAIPRLEKVLAKKTDHFQAHYLLGEIYANLGKYSQAIEACNNAIAANSFAIDPYYLLAQIADEQGDLNQARQNLNKVIYLEPNSIFAYYKLANIYQQEGNYKRSQKMQQSALKILQSMPEDAVIPKMDNLKVVDLMTQLESQLA